MNQLQEFRHYQLCEAPDGTSLELLRSEGEVACLAFDTQRHYFVEMHVLARDFNGGTGKEEERFIALAREAASIGHPSVAAVFESGSDEGTPFFVAELVDGERLDSYIARTSPLPESLAVSLVAQVARGVAALRDYPGLIAGADVMAARVVANEPDASGLVVKLTDVGLARVPHDKPPRASAVARLEVAVCDLLARVLVFASGGPPPDTATGTLKETLASSAIGGSLRRFLTSVADGGVESVDDFSGGLERWLENEGGRGAGALDADLLPVRLLEPVLRSAAAVERAIGSGYRLDHAPLGGNVVDGWPVVGGAEGRRYRVSQLPGAKLCQTPIPGQVKQVFDASRGANPRWPRLVPIAVHWPDQSGDLIAEPAPADAVTLADLAAAGGGFLPAEALWIARELDRALSEAEDAGLPVWGVGMRALRVAGHRPGRHLGEPGGSEKLYVRAHPTMAALVSPAWFSVGGRPPRSAAVAPGDPGAFLAAVRGLPIAGVSPSVRAGLDRLFAELAAESPRQGEPAAPFREHLLERFDAFLAENATRAGAGGRADARVGGVAAVQAAADAAVTAGSPPGEFPALTGPAVPLPASVAASVPDVDDGDTVDEGDEEAEAESLPGLAEVLFGEGADPEEDWNPIARSVAGAHRDAAASGRDAGAADGPGWGGPLVAFLLATAATAATLAYFMGWWPFAL